MGSRGNQIEGRPPVAVGFLFSDEPTETKAFVEQCRRAGQRPVLVRAAYEAPAAGSYSRVRVRQPMDYLSAADCDAVHEDVLTWQRAMPAVKLASGKRLATWSAGDDHPPPVWAWLPMLAPYVQVTLRALRLYRKVFEAERPMAWTCLGVKGDAAWLAPLVAQVAERAAPDAAGDPGPDRRTGRILPWPRARVPHIDYRPIRRRAAYLDALEALERHERTTRHRSRGGFAGHVVLIMRGARGTEWLMSDGQPKLIDEYSEGMPEALIAACADRRWRLTILYEGPAPRRRGWVGPSERHASFVSELSFAAFGPIAAQLRVPAREQYLPAVSRLVAEKAFRRAFTLDGVDVFDQFADYLSRSILNLSVLMTAQSEAWTRAFEALKPDVVIGGRLESKPWINLAASQTGARTASIKLGIGDEMTPSVLAVAPDGRHASTDHPDAFLVWGDRQVEHLKMRLPEYGGCLAPVGRTRSDTFVNEGQRVDVDDVRRRLGLVTEERVIVWGGTCRTRWGLWPGQEAGSAVLAPESWAACLTALADTADRCGARVVVRPHPVEDMAFVEAQARKHGGRVLVAPPRAGLHNVELLAVSDVFVSSVSSMFAEAVLMGLPAVNVWLPEIHMIYESARFDRYAEVSEPVTSVRSMAETVDRLMTDPDAASAAVARARAALPAYFGGLDGRNARRAADWALDFGAESAGVAPGLNAARGR